MTDRKKAQDVFNETNFLFSKKVSFIDAFPEIETINVEVIEDGYGVSDWTNPRRFSKYNIGEFINCSNSLCYNGGFSVGKIVRDMLAKKETHREETEYCQGYEGSPKGRRRYRSCNNNFEIKVDITYKKEE